MSELKKKEWEQKTELIYIFTNRFRTQNMKTNKEILDFIDNTIDWYISKISDFQLQNNWSIFDFNIYRFVFWLDKTNDNKIIGLNSNKSDNDKIKSFYFSSPDDAKNLYIG